MEAEMREPYSRWFQSHKQSTRSPWLISSLTELEKKTKKMIKLVEVEGDSFTKRVEIYYETRSQLISLIEDLCRSHRSLIDRYDRLRNRMLDDQFSDSPCSSSNSSKVVDSFEDSTTESVVNDGNSDEASDENEVMTMREEIESLRMDNASLKDELKNKKAGKKNQWMFSVLKFFKLFADNRYSVLG